MSGSARSARTYASVAHARDTHRKTAGSSAGVAGLRQAPRDWKTWEVSPICDERPVCQDCKDNAGDFRAAFHFTQDCPKHRCVEETCNTAPTKPCTSHCRDCGFSVVDIDELDASHKCQWTKQLEKSQVGIKDGRPALVYRFILTCKRNATHEKKTARGLKKVREKGWRRLLDDMISWLDLDEDTDPRKNRPIVECEECFAEMSEGGDYREQIPGVLRLGHDRVKLEPN
ncbi:hypothetical protein C8A03DRAFT_36285 [Achaetomium macrosporum]|uniref:Uncharacterized protein n=1 Tax=Achaetomium macrosporum TaxID=79813 RepID=A0AAN7C5M2_9PEZI|nr:hypothetical protein C8A03DRAFT_36285 [Achaetomium macrosporum]